MNDGVGCPAGMQNTFHKTDLGCLKGWKAEWLCDARTARGSEAAECDVGHEAIGGFAGAGESGDKAVLKFEEG